MTITGEGLLALAGVLVVTGAAGAVVYKYVLGPILALIGRTNEFFDDWFGVPDRDGVPGRKGVMVRLSDLEVDKLDKVEFMVVAEEVTKKATKAELLELRVALERHITRVGDTRDSTDGDVPHPREPQS